MASFPSLRRALPGELSQASQIPRGGGERELVEGPEQSTRTQPVEPQDPLEVGEQHLQELSVEPALLSARSGPQNP